MQNINNWRLQIWKTNSLFNLISQQADIDKTYLYAKDPHEKKYQFLINKRESTGVKHLNSPKASNEYSNDIGDIYQKIEKYNPNKKRKILIVFDDMIADMLSNKNLNPIVTELFIRGTFYQYSFQVFEATLESNNLSCFTQNLLERI